MTKNTAKIVPFQGSPTEYEALVEITNLIFTDYPTSIDEIKREDSLREEKYTFKRVLVRDPESNEFIGFGAYGHTYWTYHPDRYFLDVLIKPNHWGKRYGKLLYNTLRDEIVGLRGMSIETETRENLPRGIRFATDRGFVLKTTEYSALLDLESYNSERFGDLVQKLKASGFDFKNISHCLNDDENFLERYYSALCAIDDDVPWHEKPTHDPFEVFEKKFHSRADSRIPECYVIAFFNGEIAGLTQIKKSPTDPTRLYTGMSGVLKPYRRKGLVTALKVTALDWAKTNLKTADGVYPSVFTENEEDNPMFLINERLGFVRQPSFLFYTKELSQTD